MKIAVVGREGQLAQCLRIQGRARGHYVHAAGRPDVDLTKPETVGAWLDQVKPGLVVNAAAYTAVDKAETECEQAFLINATGAGELSRLCAAASIPLIHISTDFVFDGTRRRPYVETDTVLPLGTYGTSKAAGEMAVQRACPQHVILRTSWIYSAHGNNFLKTMLRLGAERAELGVVDDQRGSPTSAHDLADAILEIAPRLAAATDPSLWGTYHVTGAYETTWHGFAAEIFRQAAIRGATVPRLKAITTAEYPTPARRPAYSVLDNTKFLETFGFALPDWRASLSRCMADVCPNQAPGQVA
ncbi:MAG: dTDP-4-dehydrorhamnose reductase [Hyphomicrobium sp. 32-62-53]|nr:MAG: dTDP-4-dehydrorhamnose reductase [Hyphomicrobium sp. 12-62-95]OYY00991.1 MAG: dTDP-4-dehydrorhamnose reductase [Hyphomicrobium sp. 32-62-53]